MGRGATTLQAEMAGIEGAASLIMNPAHLSPEDALDFCGSCHRSFGDAITNGWNKIGVPNARFQPYRLEKSKCWGNGDARLRCQSCHDPHVPLEENSVAYDGSCLACHVNTSGSQAHARSSGGRMQSCAEELRQLPYAAGGVAGCAHGIHRSLDSHREAGRPISAIVDSREEFSGLRA